MSEVTDIESARRKKAKPEYVYACHCGSELFYLMKCGTIQCLGCEEIHERIAWGEPGALNP